MPAPVATPAADGTGSSAACSVGTPETQMPAPAVAASDGVTPSKDPTPNNAAVVQNCSKPCMSESCVPEAAAPVSTGTTSPSAKPRATAPLSLLEKRPVSLLEAGFKQSGDDATFHLLVPDFFARSLLVQKGEGIKKVSAMSGSDLWMLPSSDLGRRALRVAGTPDQKAAALATLLEALEDGIRQTGEQLRAATVRIFFPRHRTGISPHGEGSLQEHMQSKLGTKVSVQHEQKDGWHSYVVSGPPQDVLEACSISETCDASGAPTAAHRPTKTSPRLQGGLVGSRPFAAVSGLPAVLPPPLRDPVISRGTSGDGVAKRLALRFARRPVANAWAVRPVVQKPLLPVRPASQGERPREMSASSSHVLPHGEEDRTGSRGRHSRVGSNRSSAPGTPRDRRRMDGSKGSKSELASGSDGVHSGGRFGGSRDGGVAGDSVGGGTSGTHGAGAPPVHPRSRSLRRRHTVEGRTGGPSPRCSPSRRSPRRLHSRHATEEARSTSRRRRLSPRRVADGGSRKPPSPRGSDAKETRGADAKEAESASRKSPPARATSQGRGASDGRTRRQSPGRCASSSGVRRPTSGRSSGTGVRRGTRRKECSSPKQSRASHTHEERTSPRRSPPIRSEQRRARTPKPRSKTRGRPRPQPPSAVRSSSQQRSRSLVRSPRARPPHAPQARVKARPRPQGKRRSRSQPRQQTRSPTPKSRSTSQKLQTHTQATERMPRTRSLGR